MPVQYICILCGTTFLARVDRERKYCSLTCYRRHNAPPPTTCEICGTPFLAPPSQRRKYCSLACNGQAHRTDIDRDLWPKVVRTDTCWLWTGAKNTNGYGLIGLDGSQEFVHRLAWGLATGDPVSDETIIGHVCDVRLCLRNDDQGIYILDGIEYERHGHLWLGTRDANQRDMAQKGRAARGQRHYATRLTDDDIREIRRRVASGERQNAVAAAFDISPPQLNTIVHRTSWKHI